MIDGQTEYLNNILSATAERILMKRQIKQETHILFISCV